MPVVSPVKPSTFSNDGTYKQREPLAGGSRQFWPEPVSSWPEDNKMTTSSGLFVTLDELKYTYHPVQSPPDRPHLFTYHLTIHNQSDRTITVLARKWIIRYDNGETDVIEGEKVIGKTPELSPGSCFRYSSFHLLPENAQATGAFHGVDSEGNSVTIKIPTFDMVLPGDSGCC